MTLALTAKVIATAPPTFTLCAACFPEACRCKKHKRRKAKAGK